MGNHPKNKQPFVDFLTRKAQLFGKEKMDWQDQDAPIILGDLEEKTYSFDQAAAFILENFRKFSPKMADFAQMAFEKSWIEAEDRPGKRPGGYCTELPETQESRIFMTFGNSINEVATLAHELGHAFHSSVMWDLPSLNREYAMNVAETASTFAELIVADATLKEAKSDVEKINLLDTKMQNAIAMFMNIHARFIFENNFYLARQKGLVAEEDITELMLAAQKKATKIVLAVIILISGRANCTSLLMMCLSIISHILLAIYSAWVSMRMPINKAALLKTNTLRY